MSVSKPWLRSILLVAMSLGAKASWAETDRSKYNLFHPVPKEQMREMSTDRPDKTESPYTVDAGHFQIETDLLILTQDRSVDSGVETTRRSFGVMVSNLKAGLTNSMDLQVIVTPHQSETVETSDSPTERDSGVGDTLVRLKYNLLGNDDGPIAIGIMPFANLPTASGDMGSRRMEGGLILPFALSLPNEWSLGLMAQVNRAKNESDDHFHTEFISSFTMGHDIAGDLAGYAEFFSQSSDEDGADWIATADFGLTYALNPDVQLDAGANIGLTRAADDLNPFVGFSARY